jgi:hypothetical protein
MPLSFLRSRLLHRHVLLVTVLVLAVSCAQQPEPSVSISPEDLALWGQVAGFLVGWFHGFTMCLNLVGSLFFNVPIYTFPNSVGYMTSATSSARRCFSAVSQAAAMRDEDDQEGDRKTVERCAKLPRDQLQTAGVPDNRGPADAEAPMSAPRLHPLFEQ